MTSTISARIKSSGARLSQIEEGCPLRDVTCADDTDKVVKVLFSVETAEVGFQIVGLLQFKFFFEQLKQLNIITQRNLVVDGFWNVLKFLPPNKL